MSTAPDPVTSVSVESSPADDEFFRLLTQLRRDEGLRLTRYIDTTGNATIGYGHKLGSDSTLETCTQAMAEQWLIDDAMKACRLLAAALPWTDRLDPARRGVLRNMMFNMGAHGLLGFHHTLSDIANGRYAVAAADMAASLWHRQTGARAKRLERQMLSGEWQ